MLKHWAALILGLLLLASRCDQAWPCCFPTLYDDSQNTKQPQLRPDPPEATDTYFVVSEGAAFTQQCMFRSSGPLIADLPIGRVVGDISKLRQAKLLGDFAYLEVCAWDIDSQGGPGFGELDQVSFNEAVIEPDYLYPTSDDCHARWSISVFKIPIEWVQFPAYTPGMQQPPTPVNQQVRVDIDVGQHEPPFCMALGWVALRIHVARPVLLLHGIFSDTSAWTGPWTSQLDAVGLPYSRISMDPPKQIEEIQQNAGDIAAELDRLKSVWGVKKLNLVCHSKGGLDARHAAEGRDDVDQLIQIGTPNEGSALADRAVNVAHLIAPPVGSVITLRDFPGGAQLTTLYMKGYNRLHPTPNQNVEYRTQATRFGAAATGFDRFTAVWVGAAEASDAVVSEASAYSLPYAEHKQFIPNVTHTTQPKSVVVESTLRPDYRRLARASEVLQGGPSADVAVEGTSVAQGAEVTRAFAVDETVPTWATLLHRIGDLDVRFVDPSGDTIRADNYTQFPGVSFEEGALLGVDNGEVWEFNQPETGLWTAIVRGKDTAGQPALDWGLFVSGEGLSRTATVVVRPGTLSTGQTTNIQVTISQGGSPVTGVDSVTAFVTRPDSVTNLVTLRDNGAAPDSAANDGVYSGSYSTVLGGAHLVGFKARENAPGGGPLWSRAGHCFLEVRSGASMFRSGSNRIREVTSDIDQDGQIDSLFIDADLDIDEAATFSLVGILSDSQGNQHQASATQALGSGFSTLRLAFPGREFFEKRINGPYTLTSLALWELNGPAEWPLLHVETLDAFATTAHNYLDFEHPPIWLTGVFTDQGFSYSAAVPGYDELRISVGISVSDSGYYHWTGLLEDGEKNFVAPTSLGAAYLRPGDQTVPFTFSGYCIRRSGLDGPYRLGSFTLTGPSRGFQPDDPTTATSGYSLAGEVESPTQPYLHTDFSGVHSFVVQGVATHGSLRLFACPAGDGDSLSFLVRVVHGCKSDQATDLPPARARLERRNELTQMWFWDGAGPTDARGDTLEPSSLRAGVMEDTTRFMARAMTGSGQAFFNVDVAGRFLLRSPLFQAVGGQDTIKSADMDTRNVFPGHGNRVIGAVDQYDLDTFTHRRNGDYGGTARFFADLNFDGTVDDQDADLFMAHFGHHIPRQLVAPNGGESWAVGTTHTVSWVRGLGDSSRVSLYLRRDSAPAFRLRFAADLLDAGSSSWTHDSSLANGSDYRVEVVHTAGVYDPGIENTVGSDLSDLPFSIVGSTVSADPNDLPLHFGLDVNHPNPFRTSTTIEFALPTAQFVKLRVFDLQGRVVRTLMDGRIEAGRWTLHWDGRDGRGRVLPAGLYVYAIEAGAYRSQRKALFLR